MCLYPQLIENKKYTSTKKNGGIVPPVTDTRVKHVPIGCGVCIECRKKLAGQWKVRLMEDIKINTNSKFVTLTFNEEQLEKIQTEIILKHTEKGLESPTGYYLQNETAIYATRHFLERWRKKFKTSCRHWLITELGHTNTERIHLHGLLWTNESRQTITNIWQNGYTWIGKFVNETTINYITKYVFKTDEDHKKYKSIILTSPGIGNNYVKKNSEITQKINITEPKLMKHTVQETVIK